MNDNVCCTWIEKWREIYEIQLIFMICLRKRCDGRQSETFSNAFTLTIWIAMRIACESPSRDWNCQWVCNFHDCLLRSQVYSPRHYSQSLHSSPQICPHKTAMKKHDPISLLPQRILNPASWGGSHPHIIFRNLN